MGVAGGTSQGSGPRVLPERWREESTQPLPGNKDYGYFWWLRPHGRYYASGVPHTQPLVRPLRGADRRVSDFE
jgi:hypothetical protein